MFIPVLDNIKIHIYKNSIKITGPLGQVVKKKSPNIKILQKDNKLYFLNQKAKKENIFFANILLKLIFGISKGYYVTLLIQGVGYKMSIVESNKLLFKLGFSNEIIFNLPENIKVFFSSPNKIIVYGNNLQKVSQVAAEIRSLRSPEPYKGKGISYQNEIIKRKIGKKN